MKHDVEGSVPAAEFARNFGHYRMVAQREPVAVSSHGALDGYFIGATQYEEFLRFRQRRRSFATAELPDDTVAAVESSRMDPEHDDLDALLDPR